MNYGNKNFMICLSKNGNDEFINAFAFGAGFQIAQEVDIDTEEPILFRSIVKKDLINHRLSKGLPFYYMDSGYFGNYKSEIRSLVMNSTSKRSP